MNRFISVIACSLLVGCGPNVLWIGKSPDRQHRAEIVSHRGEQFVRVDGREHSHFLNVVSDGLSWSPDSSRIAYPARTREGWVVVVNGSASKTWSGIGEIAWSPDSVHVAYSAENRAFWVVVRDNANGPPFDGIMTGGIVFSRNSKRLGYVVQDGRRLRVIVDGRAQPKYDGIGRLSFSADSEHFVYLARSGDQAFIVTDDVPSSPFESIADFVLSPSGFRLAYLAKTNGRWHAVVDGALGSDYDAIDKPVFDQSGKRFAYATRKGAVELVVVDGTEGAPFDAILRDSVTFDHSGEQIAYAARRGNTWRIVLNGVEGKEFEKIEHLRFGERVLGFVAKDGKTEFAVVDGHPGPGFDDVGELVFGAVGRRYAYVATKGKQSFVVHDGGQVALDLAVDETLVFSPDGLHWACLAGDSKEKKFYITIDGLSRRPFDSNELVLEMTRTNTSGAMNAELVRRWISAELDLALKPIHAGASPVQSRRP